MQKKWNKYKKERPFSVKFNPSHRDLDKAIAEYIDKGGKINKIEVRQEQNISKARDNTYEDADNFLHNQEVFFRNILQFNNFIVGA